MAGRIVGGPSMSLEKVDLRWIAVLAATLALILIVNPVGFMGGGLDDWQYLNAARCWAEHGPCLPHDHWQGRWPVVAPLGAIIALLGESRFTVGLPSLAYSVGCLGLLATLGNRLAGKPVGYLAALLLLVTPVFAAGLLDPSVEAAELFFLLAAAYCTARYTDRHSSWFAFAAGLSLSMAFQVRETAIAGLPIAVLALWLLARHDRKAWLFAAAGALTPLLVEALIFWLSTGDPLWRRELSMAHTQISSTELDGPVDRTHSPILNPNYIAHWRREPGIHIHWLIDGLVNLLVNTKAGLTLPLSLLFFAGLGRTLTPQRRTAAAWCLGIALYWACFLIYVLAIDPKPRMMMMPISLSALALSAILVDRASKGSRLFAIAVVAITALLGLKASLTSPTIHGAERAVNRWTAQYPGQIEADETMRRHFALTNAGQTLPDLGSGRAMLILRPNLRCSIWAAQAAGRSVVVVDRAPFDRFERESDPAPGNFCLFRYVRPMTADQIKSAFTAEQNIEQAQR